MIKILLAVVSREEGATISPHACLNLIELRGALDDSGLKAVEVFIQVTPHNLVRARSRMAAMALDDGYSHIWFWDADVSITKPVPALKHMLALEEDVVFTAYRKKREPEIDVPVVWLPDPPNRKKHGVEIAACGMGCTLISRSCLQRMHDATRRFSDTWGGVKRQPHAMFMLRHVGEELMPEDYSFCFTWRELGGTVWLNMADSAVHYGAHAFRMPKDDTVAE